MRKNFVVYAHYTLDTNKLFYIGEGSIKRSKSSFNRNRWWRYKVNKHGFIVKILYNNLTKKEAEKIESRLIKNLKKRNCDIVNICIGPMLKNHWILSIPKELHPMYGKKRPECSERLKQWNKEHCGSKSPVHGLKRPDLIERNKSGLFIRFKKPIICNETGQTFESVSEAIKILGYSSKCSGISKVLTGIRKHYKGFTYSYLKSQ